MKDPQGRVVAVTGTPGQGQALIDVDAALVCERCAQGKGCGALVFGSSMKKRRVEVMIPADLDIQIGDAVRVTLEPRNILRAAAIVYGWPLIGAATGAGFAYLGGYGDVGAAGCALLGLAIGAALGRLRLSRSRCLQQFTPRIVV